MRILVTAGPTVEYWDDIRFLSNRSSGKMGFEIARAGARMGHHVTLISGPVTLKPPSGVKYLAITSAREMKKMVDQVFPKVDLVVMAAAVCDFRPKKRHSGKLKKRNSPILSMELVKNPDILKSLGARKGTRKLIGFALEVSRGEKNAREKLREKNLDYVVLNDPSSFEGDKASVKVIGSDGSLMNWSRLSKMEIGKRLIGLAKSETSWQEHRRVKRKTKKKAK